MYDLTPTSSYRTPLDFNPPRRTDTVADALDSDHRGGPRGRSRSPARWRRHR